MVEFVRFPEVSSATSDGLLATGGDLSVNTLVSAYAQGIFPWFNEDQPIMWWSPDPRMVLYPDHVRVSRSLKKKIKQQIFTVTCNTAFNDVIQGCSLRGQPAASSHIEATWITPAMLSAYNELHTLGYAHSIEVWRDNQLAGGLYGIALGNVFFGESMFSRVTDSSKVALVALCHWLVSENFCLIDCQVSNSHLVSLGAEEIPRAKFMQSIYKLDINQAKLDFSNKFNNFVQKNGIISL